MRPIFIPVGDFPDLSVTLVAETKVERWKQWRGSPYDQESGEGDVPPVRYR